MSKQARRFFPTSSFSPSTSFVSMSSSSMNPSLTAKSFLLAMRNGSHFCQHQRQCQRRYLRQNGPLIIVERKFSGSSSSSMFSSNSQGKGKDNTSKNQSSSPSPTAEQPTMTMEGLWKDSTTRMLDRETTPIGSMTSLQWHLAETLVLYWSTNPGEPPSKQNHNHNRHHHHNHQPPRRTENGGDRVNSNPEEDWFEATKKGNRLSLQILDRLADEKIEARKSRPATEDKAPTAGNINESESTEDEDFRTIDVSLIHSVLKQWKDCLHWANKKHKNSRHNRHRNSRIPRQQQQHQVPNQSKTHDSRQDFATATEILLPSELLQKLDNWAYPAATTAAAATATTITAVMAGAEAPHSASVSTTASLFEPNIATYTILMDGAVSCRNFRERVTFTEDLLNRLLRESSSAEDSDASRLRPTVVTIGTVIHALANSRSVDSAEKAEAWLRKIPTLYDGDPSEEEDNDSEGDATRMKPNTVIYTTVIRAWADVGRADRAEGLLREMCQDYVGDGGDNSGNPHAEPSLWTFNTVLAAWSRSKNPSSVIQAEGLIRTMKAFSSPLSRRSARALGDGGRGGRNDGALATNNNHHRDDDDDDNDDDGDDRSSVLKLDVFPAIVSYNSLMSTIASRSKQPDSLARAEYWMEEILANATAAAATERKPSPVPRNRNHQGRGRGHKTGRKNDDSMAPNLITFKALFNIISSANNMSNTEKSDRMRYWLARGSSPSLSPKNHSADNDRNTKNNIPDANSIAENPYLLEQIDAMEQQEKKR